MRHRVAYNCIDIKYRLKLMKSHGTCNKLKDMKPIKIGSFPYNGPKNVHIIYITFYDLLYLVILLKHAIKPFKAKFMKQTNMVVVVLK